MYRCYTNCSCVPYIKYLNFSLYTDTNRTKLWSPIFRASVCDKQKNRNGNRLKGNLWRREYYLFINTFFRWKKRARELYFTHTKKINPTSKIKPGTTYPVLIADINNERDFRKIEEFQERGVYTNRKVRTKPAWIDATTQYKFYHVSNDLLVTLIPSTTSPAAELISIELHILTKLNFSLSN